MDPSSSATEERRRLIQSVFSPPTVDLKKPRTIDSSRGTHLPQPPPNNNDDRRKSCCSLCHCCCDTDCEMGDMHDDTNQQTVVTIVKTVMMKSPHKLEDDLLTFCSFCLSQLQNLVTLKTELDSLGKRLATMVSGLESLFLLPPVVGVQEADKVPLDDDLLDVKPALSDVLQQDDEKDDADVSPTPPPHQRVSKTRKRVLKRKKDGPVKRLHSLLKRHLLIHRWRPILPKPQGHLKTHLPEEETPSFDCQKCSKRFTTKLGRNAHLKKVHGDRTPVKCQRCGKEFSGKDTLSRHVSKVQSPKQIDESVTTAKRFPCPTCDKTFVSEQNLRSHAFLHTGEKPFLCSVCEVGFATRKGLRQHEVVHSKDKPHLCHICGKGFAQISAFKIQVKGHEPEDEKPFPCPDCPRRFAVKSRLVKHSKIHSSGARRRKGPVPRINPLVKIPNVCNICSRTFATKHTLDVHLAVHMPEDEKPFPCYICPSRFAIKSRLDKHSKLHSVKTSQGEIKKTAVVIPLRSISL